MHIVNLTPHEIKIVLETGTISIPSTGIARVESKTVPCGQVDGIPVTKTTFGKVEGLPAEEDGVSYIVSRIVATAALRENPGRMDLFVPGLQVRDEAGNVIGCKSLDLAQ